MVTMRLKIVTSVGKSLALIAGPELPCIHFFSGQAGSGLSPHVAAGAVVVFAEVDAAATVAEAEADAEALVMALAVGSAEALAVVTAVLATATTEAEVAGRAGVSLDAVAPPPLDPPPGQARRSTAGRSATTGKSAARQRRRVSMEAESTLEAPAGDMPRLSMPLTLVELISRTRDGLALAPEDVRRMVAAYMRGELADYQMSAWLMAVYFRGMRDDEMVALTRAMLHSGRVLDLSGVPGVKVDKHSTGGVGDKVSIALAPLVAACGVPVPMVSGRGLGHTGGTLDKLEAIPGFRTDLPTDRFVRIVAEVGTSMIGQTADIAPADKRIYALRDVTATVECVPLIVASILSKKLAEGIDALVLDVKAGRGAFMKDLGRARELAEALVRVGKGAGKKVVAVLTDMESPLGRAVGNAIETREALELLHGQGPDDLAECTRLLAAEMLVLGGKARDAAGAREILERAVASGDAARVAEKMIAAHGGDARVVADPSRLELAPVEVVVPAPREGWVGRLDALEIGLAAMAMGAGRTRADQAVDHGVGIRLERKPGDRVAKGDPLARLYVRAAAPEAAARVEAAFAIFDAAPAARPLVLGRIE
jgi:pyrimidine-nucleoside phosphorylase